MYTLTNILSNSPINSNTGFNNAWIQVDNNADRLLYAQVVYATNMNETLTNVVSNSPINSNTGFNNAWIQVNNNADRTLYAQAVYISNLDALLNRLATLESIVAQLSS